MATTPEVGYLPDGAQELDAIGQSSVAWVTLGPDRSARRDEPAEFIPLRQRNSKPSDGPLLNPDEKAMVRSLGNWTISSR